MPDVRANIWDGSKARQSDDLDTLLVGGLKAVDDLVVDDDLLFVDVALRLIGIGTSSPNQALDVAGTIVIDRRSAGANPRLQFNHDDLTTNYWIEVDRVNGKMNFVINGLTAQSIDLSGNILVGKTAASSGTAGCELRANGLGVFVRDGDKAMFLNRLNDYGDILDFRQDGSLIGSVSMLSNLIQLNGPGGIGSGIGIDSNGVALLGKTATDTTAVGVELHQDGFCTMARDGNTVMILNRKTSKGEVLEVRIDNVKRGTIGVGDIGAIDDTLQLLGSNDRGLAITSGGDVIPNSSADQDLGASTNRWNDLYVDNTPNVSDRRRKNSIAEIPWAEALIDELEPVTYVYNGKKRPRTGFIAQQVKEAMNKVGIEDWAGYAYDEKEDLHTLRDNQFTAVAIKVIKSQGKRINDLEERLLALEAKLG